MSTQDGGPAFPHAHEDYEFQRGMTLRDYFAAAALTGYRARYVGTDSDIIAQAAYMDADAMLAERAKRKEAQP